MLQKLKRDSFYLGAGLGILIPLLSFGVLLLIVYFLRWIGLVNANLEFTKIALISLTTNLFSLRYYLVSLKFDKTGRGILLLTFLMAIAIFYFIFQY